MMRAPSCCGKVNVKKTVWTPEEDAKMVAYVSKHGTGNWTSLPKKAGLRRCGKSCRLRWTNYLRPDLNHENFTPQEEELIVRLHAAIGSRWSMIAQQLPGRSDNDVKNYWNTKLKKKLTDMGIDPVTHKPFSQILSDYGNIGCLPTKYGSSTLNRDLKHAFIPNPRQAIPIPKMEPFPQQSNPSLYLLDQLQAIKLVTEASSYRNYDHNTIISDHLFINGAAAATATSSSSSTCSTGAQEKAAMSFSWRDFLLDDAFEDRQQEQENISVGVQDYDEENMIAIGFEISGKLEENGGNGINGELEQTSHTSFVETLLHKEAEIFCDFPNLLEEPFSYEY